VLLRFLIFHKFAAKEKLEIVIGAAEPRLRAGLSRPDDTSGRNAFELS
jgi:hypothetical protein